MLFCVLDCHVFALWDSGMNERDQSQISAHFDSNIIQGWWVDQMRSPLQEKRAHGGLLKVIFEKDQLEQCSKLADISLSLHRETILLTTGGE